MFSFIKKEFSRKDAKHAKREALFCRKHQVTSAKIKGVCYILALSLGNKHLHYRIETGVSA